MARIKTVCMNCGNIMMAGNGTSSGGDYADAKLVYIKVCSNCTTSKSSKSGCAVSLIVLLIFSIAISLLLL